MSLHGIRVYNIHLGEFTKFCHPVSKEFRGHCRTEPNADAVAAVAPMPGNERLVVVLGRNVFPFGGSEFPRTVMSSDRLCLWILGSATRLYPEGVRVESVLHLDPYYVDLSLYLRTRRVSPRMKAWLCWTITAS